MNISNTINNAYTSLAVEQKRQHIPLPTTFRQEYLIYSGFWLSIIDYHPQHPAIFYYEKDSPMINFGYTIAGQLINKVRSPGQDAVDYHNKEGFGGILYQPQRVGEIHLPANQHIKVLHLHLEPSVFYKIFERDKESIPKKIDTALNSRRNNFCFRGRQSLQLKAILCRLIKGAPAGMPRHLFYESLALGLISCQIGEINRVRDSYKYLPSEKIQEQILAAAELLVQNFESPPTLYDLTIATGLNANKLQSGFQQVFGCSVFRYLHSYKMEHAKQLLSGTDMNVSEVATVVGYSNLSHFSGAFRKFFGVLPKKYQNSIRS